MSFNYPLGSYVVVKNSLHVVLRRIVHTYPVWQGGNSKEIQVWRGGRGLAGLGGCKGLFLPWLLHLGSGRAGGFPLLQLEGSPGRRGAVDARVGQHHQTSRESSLDTWVWISGLLLELMCNALCAEQPPALGSPQRADSPDRKGFHLCVETPESVTSNGSAGRRMSRGARMYQWLGWVHWVARGEQEQGRTGTAVTPTRSCLHRAGCQQLPGSRSSGNQAGRARREGCKCRVQHPAKCWCSREGCSALSVLQVV